MRIEGRGLALVMSLYLGSAVHATDSARWELPADSRAFERLWLTMDSLHDGEPCTLSVLYIGGSHVQGGSIGHGLRAELNRWAPHAERARGMQLPYRIAQTNTPTHFRTEFEGHWTACQLTRGPQSARCAASCIGTGIVAFPHGVSRIQHVSYFPDSARATATALEIWTNAAREQWTWDGNSMLRHTARLPGELGWRLKFDGPADTLAIQFHGTPSDSIWYAGMCTQPRGHRASVVVHEWGHNGCRIEHAADQVGWAALLNRLEPDLILVGIGLNDAIDRQRLDLEEFGSNYARFFATLEMPQAAIVLLGNTPALFRGKPLADANANINGWLREFGGQHGAAFMDLSAALGGDAMIEHGMREGLMKADGMHFTPEGYAGIARLIVQGWENAYQHQRQTPK